MFTMYLVCAVVGGTLIVCQFLMTLMGIGGGDMADGGHDFSAGHDLGVDQGLEVGAGHEHDHGGLQEHGSSWIFGVLTFRTLTAAFAFFGFTGLSCMQLGLEPMTTLLWSLAAGLVALFLVAWLMRMLIRLNVDGTVRIERSVGSRGTVYLSVPGQRSGEGKVHVGVLGRRIEYKAVTARESLATGTPIVVVGVAGPDTVEVASAVHAERASHV